MARVEIIIKDNKFELEDEINKIIQNLKFEEFDIRFSANESYPYEVERTRFYSAMVVLKDK